MSDGGYKALSALLILALAIDVSSGSSRPR